MQRSLIRIAHAVLSGAAIQTGTIVPVFIAHCIGSSIAERFSNDRETSNAVGWAFAALAIALLGKAKAEVIEEENNIKMLGTSEDMAVEADST